VQVRECRGGNSGIFASGASSTIYRFNPSIHSSSCCAGVKFHHFSPVCWVDPGFTWIFSPVVFTVEILVDKSRKHPVDATVRKERDDWGFHLRLEGEEWQLQLF
jgi:hypothetical protein